MRESIILINKGAKWWHTQDWEGPNLSIASCGRFFHAVLAAGAQVGDTFFPHKEGG